MKDGLLGTRWGIGKVWKITGTSFCGNVGGPGASHLNLAYRLLVLLVSRLEERFRLVD